MRADSAIYETMSDDVFWYSGTFGKTHTKEVIKWLVGKITVANENPHIIKMTVFLLVATLEALADICSRKHAEEILIAICESNESRTAKKLPSYEDAFRIYGVDYKPPYEALERIVAEIEIIRNRVYTVRPD